MMNVGRAMIRTASSPRDSCCCCSCFNLQFLQTKPGMIKIAELVLGMMCECMLINYGGPQASLVGMSYYSLLTATSTSVSTVTLLLICYVFSAKSVYLVRSSLYETFFNASAAMSYLSASVYLAVAVNIVLYPLYIVSLGLIAYPAMVSAYMMGFALGVLHAIDAYCSFRFYKSS